MENPRIFHLYPEDKIAISFSIVIILIQAFYFAVSQTLLPIGLLLVLIILIYLQNKSDSKTLKFLRSYIHIPYYGIIFTAFQSFVHKLNPNDYDLLLLNTDMIFFRFDITVWLEQFINTVLTEILTFSYFSYYVLPTLTFAILFFSKNTGSLIKTRNYLLSIVIGWYGAFIFYLILPAAGPDIAFPEHYKVMLQGLSPITNSYLDNLGKYLRESNVRNTFPSMHFGIILITNYFAFKYKRIYFWLCTMPFGVMLGIATVYLRQHYLIDLAASFPIAITGIYLSFKLNVRFK